MSAPLSQLELHDLELFWWWDLNQIWRAFV
jgi:hypothetical protein